MYRKKHKRKNESEIVAGLYQIEVMSSEVANLLETIATQWSSCGLSTCHKCRRARCRRHSSRSGRVSRTGGPWHARRRALCAGSCRGRSQTLPFWSIGGPWPKKYFEGEAQTKRELLKIFNIKSCFVQILEIKKNFK